MFREGDLVRPKTTGMTGKVIGYGYSQVRYSYYLTTLKVELESYSPTAPTAGDLCDQWQICQDRCIRAFSLPHFLKFNGALSKIG